MKKMKRECYAIRNLLVELLAPGGAYENQNWCASLNCPPEGFCKKNKITKN